MTTVKNNNGFGAIEALLILVVVGIVGFTGWFVYHSKQVADKTLAQTGNSSTVQLPKKPATKTPAPVTAAPTKYLVIKEWGVKIPLTKGIADAVYAIRVFNGGQSADLSTSSLTALDRACGVGGTPPGGIARQTAAAHAANQTKNDLVFYPVYSNKLGNYYYQYSHAQSACSNNNAANQLQLTQSALFSSASEGLQPAN